MVTSLDVFDQCDFVYGELLWNFADFAMPAGLIRVNEDKKGAFTRDRQPKQIVYDLKKRWEISRFEIKILKTRFQFELRPRLFLIKSVIIIRNFIKN